MYCCASTQVESQQQQWSDNLYSFRVCVSFFCSFYYTLCLIIQWFSVKVKFIYLCSITTNDMGNDVSFSPVNPSTVRKGRLLLVNRWRMCKCILHFFSAHIRTYLSCLRHQSKSHTLTTVLRSSIQPVDGEKERATLTKLSRGSVWVRAHPLPPPVSQTLHVSCILFRIIIVLCLFNKKE